MAIPVQFAIGLLFGLGLLIAGMSDPAKVLNFLDLAAIGSGRWDASLAFVMVGAIAVASRSSPNGSTCPRRATSTPASSSGLRSSASVGVSRASAPVRR